MPGTVQHARPDVIIMVLMGLAVLGCALVLYLHRAPGDAVTLLLLGLVVAFAFPQRFVVPGLDSGGAPGLLVGTALFGMWTLGRVYPRQPLDPRPDATPVIAGVYLAVWLLGMALGELRPHPGANLESTARDVIGILSILGYLLYTRDAIRTQHDLERVLRAMVLLGSAVALFGVVQFLLGFDPLRGLNLPLLVEAETFERERIRSGFIRVRGTAFHPIEFSVVMAMLLPIAIGFAVRSARRARRWLFGVCAALLGVAALMSVSRSGTVTIVASLTVVAIHLELGERLRLLLAALGGLLLLYLAVPGLLETIQLLFTEADTDPSITGRLEDIPFVLDVLGQNALVGQNDPSVGVSDRLLDNEYYGRVLRDGLIGLSALLLLLAAPLALAWCRARIGEDRDARTHAGMIAAGLTAGAVSLFTFDGFFFKLYISTLLVLVAAGTAAWRLRDEDPAAVEAAPPRTRVTLSSAPAAIRSAPRSRRPSGRAR